MIRFIDDYPKFESMSPVKHYSWDARKFSRRGNSINYSHLRRFLDKHVGQDWDFVWSEISKHPDFSKHKDQVLWFVSTKCYVGDDGHIYSGRNHFRVDITDYQTHRFYVHPNTDELMKTRIKKAPPAQKKTIELNGETFIKYNGVYYAVKLTNLGYNWLGWPVDSLTKKQINIADAIELYGDSVFCTSKRQATKKENKELRKIKDQ